jgi:hypothetical protein
MRMTARLCAVVLVAAAAWAQNPPAGDICRIFFVKPKPGMDQHLEAGRKKHVQFHKSHNDTWAWNTFQIETGMNTGTYVTSTCGHEWKDFDDWEKSLGKADAADATANMGAYEQQAWSSFYRFRADLSLGSGEGPAALSAVYVYRLHRGKVDDFVAATKKIADALRAAKWPQSSGWLELVNGGEGPAFVLVLGRKGWADFAPGAKTVFQVVEEAYGKEQADAIWKGRDATVAQSFTEAATYRPDLSYVPGKK